MDNSENEIKRKKIELLKALQAKKQVEKDNYIKTIDLSPIQIAYICASEKIRMLVGANRSGKSFIGALDVIVRALGIFPECIKDIFNKALLRVGEYWITSLDFPSSREITQRKILSLIPKNLITFFNKEFRELSTTIGSIIGFKSADSGREKFQGTSKVGVWNDEETPEDVWDEEYMRTIDCMGWMSLTFTPLKGLTWAYKLYKMAHRYVYSKNIHGIEEGVGIVHTLEEIKLLKERRVIEIRNTDVNASDQIAVFQMSIYDNKTLPDTEIQNAENKYKNDVMQYNARILGKFTKFNGRAVYDIENLIKRQANVPSAFKIGEIRNGMFCETRRGSLTLYRDKKDIGKGQYVIGADVAEGIETGDYSCVQLLDRYTCEQVAVWHGHISPEEFAVVLYNMGRFFNNAFIGVERNMHGYGVLKRLREMKYVRLYCDYDQATSVVKANVDGDKRYGWHTNEKTKPVMIQDLAAFLNNNHIKLNDFNTIEELTTFVYNKDGKTEAMGGCHDDRVMALAIALQMFRNCPIIKPSVNTNIKNNIRVSDITNY